MVTDLEALAGGARRYVGRAFDSSVNGWVPSKGAVEVPDKPEYRQAVKDGDLLPADEATAKLCKVAFKK